jgi:pentose-5-phosphate-3-epimerase
VDGGILPDNIKIVQEAGADEVTVGRRLIGGDVGASLKKYQQALGQ